MGLIALGYVARDQKMVGSETVMTATTASWAFWIVGALRLLRVSSSLLRADAELAA